MKINIVFMFITFLFSGCKKNNTYFNEQLLEIENKIPNEKLTKFSKLNEKKALYISLNDTVFKNKIKSNINLKNYFKSRKINDFEDILIIFYTSLHRKLNNKVINLDRQIEETLKIRNKISRCNKFQQSNFVKNNKFTINDTIKIRIKIKSSGLIDYPMECKDLQWIFNDNNDFIILGKINKKYYFKSIPNKTFMSVRIINLNKTSIEIPKIGQDFNFDISYLIIEKKLDSADMF